MSDQPTSRTPHRPRVKGDTRSLLLDLELRGITFVIGTNGQPSLRTPDGKPIRDYVTPDEIERLRQDRDTVHDHTMQRERERARRNGKRVTGKRVQASAQKASNATGAMTQAEPCEPLCVIRGQVPTDLEPWETLLIEDAAANGNIQIAERSIEQVRNRTNDMPLHDPNSPDGLTPTGRALLHVRRSFGAMLYDNRTPRSMQGPSIIDQLYRAPEPYRAPSTDPNAPDAPDYSGRGLPC